MNRLYAPLYEGMQRSLKDIFEGGYPADKVLQRQLKFNKKWGSHDRRLFAESVYGIVRWWRKLLFAVDVPWPADERWSRAEDEVYAAVVQAWCLLNEIELDRKITRLKLNAAAVRSVWEDKSLPRAVAEAIPDWLDAWAAQSLGEARWTELLPILNSVAPVYLRANRLKASAAQVVAALKAEKIEADVVTGDAVVLRRRSNVFLTKAFKAGLFEVQDLNSQSVGAAVKANAGERVIDACAGAGGKSLQIAAQMENKGRIVAMDVHARKLEQLRERATRAGASLIEVREIESTKTIKRLADSADRVLLDVPCSGLGVLRRNPDSKWKLTAEEITRVQGLQREILSAYPAMVKVGGHLLYATCSIMPDENETRVAEFVSQNETAWKLEEQHTLWPERDGGDGFFWARLKRLS
jgi:16S rRNA (cytosine967-C5)-methyltransferase